MATVAFLEEYDAYAKGWPSFRIRAEDLDCDYYGPSVDVYRNDMFVFVSTDQYEGTAMFNIEALPQLIEALQRLCRNRSRLGPVPASSSREKTKGDLEEGGFSASHCSLRFVEGSAR